VRGGEHRRLDLRGARRAARLIVASATLRRGRAKPVLSREGLELLATRFRALGDATRLALLQAMFERERTVQELASTTETSPANASKHLALLLEQGLVGRRREGLFTYYRIADPTLEPLCRLVCDSLAERHETRRAILPG
jgi:DNA-binding transcriptional ArsR family regulator